jgi:hypothetical protein
MNSDQHRDELMTDGVRLVLRLLAMLIGPKAVKDSSDAGLQALFDTAVKRIREPKVGAPPLFLNGGSLLGLRGFFLATSDDVLTDRGRIHLRAAADWILDRIERGLPLDDTSGPATPGSSAFYIAPGATVKRLSIADAQSAGSAHFLRNDGEIGHADFQRITHTAKSPLDHSQMPAQHSNERPYQYWYQRWIGQLGIGVAVAVIGAAAIVAIKHYLPSLGF